MKVAHFVNALTASLLLAGLSVAQVASPNNGQDNSLQATNPLSRFDLRKLDITKTTINGMNIVVVNKGDSTVEGSANQPTGADSTGALTQGPIAFASAPALSVVVIAFVCSTDLGPAPAGQVLCEQINSGQVGTVNHQGGAQEFVVEQELGYGANPVATMNGVVLSSSLLTTSNICQDFSGNLTFNCQPGEVIVGFQHVYNTASFQNGRFTYQNTSINAPFNTLSTFIQVN
ncbi:MAG TPA: DUF4879 domain-containing protein [Candidatus Angelobacter sp.]|nr:DUF4879 domain-containing protein [Candidatus Angelobacter sp.]